MAIAEHQGILLRVRAQKVQVGLAVENALAHRLVGTECVHPVVNKTAAVRQPRNAEPDPRDRGFNLLAAGDVEDVGGTHLGTGFRNTDQDQLAVGRGLDVIDCMWLSRALAPVLGINQRALTAGQPLPYHQLRAVGAGLAPLHQQPTVAHFH